MRILAGIDLPSDLVCGSLLLSRDMYKSMTGSGDEVRFFSLPPAKGEPLLDTEELAVEKSGSNCLEYIEALRLAMENALGSWRPDVVHSHHLAYGMAQALMGMDFRVPKVGFAHGTDIFDSRHDVSIARTASVIANSCNVIIFPTVSLVRDALDIGIQLNSERIRVIPWGIPLASDYTELPKVGRRGRGPAMRLLIASRFTANKDISTAIEAMALLPSDVVLSVYGEGREAEALLSMASSLRLQDRVTFLPMVSREALWEQMLDHDCALFPTRETEAFGLFGIECQAHGLPLITSDLPVFGEVFGGSALRFRAGDPRSLAKNILSVLEDQRLAGSLRGAGYANARRYEIRSRAGEIRDAILAGRCILRG